MLENEITEEDTGSWYEIKNGSLYVRIDTVPHHSEGLRVEGRILSLPYEKLWWYRNGSYHKEWGSGLDLIRKLDPIEVNLLRLEQKLSNIKY